MDNLNKEIVGQFESQIKSRDKIIDELLDMHTKDQENTRSLVIKIIKFIGLFVVIPVCLAFTIIFCVFCYGYFWSDYSVSQYSNSYNTSSGSLTIGGGENNGKEK